MIYLLWQQSPIKRNTMATTKRIVYGVRKMLHCMCSHSCMRHTFKRSGLAITVNNVHFCIVYVPEPMCSINKSQSGKQMTHAKSLLKMKESARHCGCAERQSWSLYCQIQNKCLLEQQQKKINNNWRRLDKIPNKSNSPESYMPIAIFFDNVFFCVRRHIKSL